jgi:hypothetical protein
VSFVGVTREREREREREWCIEPTLELMNVYQIVLAVLAVAVLAFAVRWQYGRTMADVTSGERGNVIPASTPFSSALCGTNGEYCRDLDLDRDFELR